MNPFYDTMSVTHTGILHEVNKLIGESSLEDAATLNASFNADNLLEENHQVFNNVYLEVSIAGADTLSAAQKANLFAIAEQCQLTGGRAVYQARAFLSWLWTALSIMMTHVRLMKTLERELIMKKYFLNSHYLNYILTLTMAI